MSWVEWAGEEAAGIRGAGRWRTVRELDGPGPDAVVLGDGHAGAARHVVSFASNDYLGLTRHPAVVAAAHDALDLYGTGAGSARLVAGSRTVHRELEAELAGWKAAERALLFATGYTANIGVLAALAGPGVLILSDELNHASIVDGCRLARASGAEVEVYPHRDLAAVEAGLRRSGHPRHRTGVHSGRIPPAMYSSSAGGGAGERGGRAMVVTDAVFSMDGDSTGVEELAELCGRHGALLVLDEAHAVLGPEPPAGRCELLRVGTLSKALASAGGFVAGPAPLVELLANRARPFMFTTAPPPSAAAAALAALRVARSPEGEALRRRLRQRVARLAGAGAAAAAHGSPIVPVVVGPEAGAVEASAHLLERGLLVPAIRPPTVAPGTSRLRVALSAAHTEEHVDRLASALGELGLLQPHPVAP